MNILSVNVSNLIIAGNKIYSVCPYCKKFIRINKPFVGSIHLCLSPKERDTIDAKLQEKEQ